MLMYYELVTTLSFLRLLESAGAPKHRQQVTVGSIIECNTGNTIFTFFLFFVAFLFFDVFLFLGNRGKSDVCHFRVIDGVVVK